MSSELKVGDLVETIKGAKFWGRLVSVYEIRPGEMRGDVVAIDPAFEDTLHVYPLKQLRLRLARFSQDRAAVIEAEYLLVKRGLYWRSNSAGYTSDVAQAGIYNEAYSAARTQNPDVTRIALTIAQADAIRAIRSLKALESISG